VIPAIGIRIHKRFKLHLKREIHDFHIVDLSCGVCHDCLDNQPSCLYEHCGFVLLVPLSCLFSLVDESTHPHEPNVELKQSSTKGFQYTPDVSSSKSKSSTESDPIFSYLQVSSTW